MKTADVINSLRGARVFNIFINEFQKRRPIEGDIDILSQRGSTVYCIEIKEVGFKNKEKKISEGINQLNNDKGYIILDRIFLIRQRYLLDFTKIKLILIVILPTKCTVYLFNNLASNKEKILERAKILEFSEFLDNIERYLSF